MPLINVTYVNGEKGKKQFSLKHKSSNGTIEEPGLGNELCCIYKNADNSYSLWRILRHSTFRECVAFEDFIFSKKNGKIEITSAAVLAGQPSLSRFFTKLNESNENFVTFDEFYEQFFCTEIIPRDFNSIRTTNDCNIYDLAILIEGALAHEVILPQLKPIEDKIKDDTFHRTTSFIERVGEDETMVRIFSQHKGRLYEHSRIWTKGTKSIFLKNTFGIWNECESDLIPYFLSFPINGMDELEGTHIGNIMKRAHNNSFLTLEICLSLLCPAFENLVEMGYFNLFSKILKTTYDIMKIKKGLSVLGNVKWDAASFAEFIGYPSYVIPIINYDSRCIDVIFNSTIRDEVRKYIKEGNRERSIRLINLFNNRPKTFPLSEYCKTLKKCCQAGEDMSAIAAYINTFAPDKYILAFAYYDYIYMFYDIGKAEAKRHGFKVMPKLGDVNKEHDRMQECFDLHRMFDKFNVPEQQEKFKESVKKCDRYVFSFNGMHIKVPESSCDIYMEGHILHHCVGTYVKKVIQGETNILFIRKDGAPDKPFYTMEIKDGEIRQCFGLCNCSITGEVEEFLKKFCKEKYLSFIQI